MVQWDFHFFTTELIILCGWCSTASAGFIDLQKVPALSASFPPPAPLPSERRPQWVSCGTFLHDHILVTGSLPLS